MQTLIPKSNRQNSITNDRAIGDIAMTTSCYLIGKNVLSKSSINNVNVKSNIFHMIYRRRTTFYCRQRHDAGRTRCWSNTNGSPVSRGPIIQRIGQHCCIVLSFMILCVLIHIVVQIFMYIRLSVWKASIQNKGDDDEIFCFQTFNFQFLFRYFSSKVA